MSAEIKPTGMSGVQRLTTAALCSEITDDELYATIDQVYSLVQLSREAGRKGALHESLGWLDGLVLVAMRRSGPTLH